MAQLVINKHKDIWDILKWKKVPGEGRSEGTGLNVMVKLSEAQIKGVHHLGLRQEFKKCGGGVEEGIYQAEQDAHWRGNADLN